jgi:hypothetical protein
VRSMVENECFQNQLAKEEMEEWVKVGWPKMNKTYKFLASVGWRIEASGGALLMIRCALCYSVNALHSY